MEEAPKQPQWTVPGVAKAVAEWCGNVHVGSQVYEKGEEYNLGGHETHRTPHVHLI